MHPPPLLSVRVMACTIQHGRVPIGSDTRRFVDGTTVLC